MHELRYADLIGPSSRMKCTSRTVIRSDSWPGDEIAEPDPHQSAGVAVDEQLRRIALRKPLLP